jgi:PIN domain nuclease of toxin-antitoxin system
MKLLLDTHTFIWFVENDANLPTSSKIQIEDTDNEIFVSVISLWEIAIKVSLGKLDMTLDLPTIINLIEENGFIILPISPEHTVYVSELPFYHRDPFDRMLIAQTFVEKLTIISKDAIFNDYGVDCRW